MKTYLISSGEYSDYGVYCILQVDALSEEELRSYNLEATRRRSLRHNEYMEKIADYLSIPREPSNYDYIQVVGYKTFNEATEALGYSPSPDFLMEVLKEHGIVDIDFEEYNLDDL